MKYVLAKIRTVSFLLIAGGILAGAGELRAQETEAAAEPEANGSLRVFLDCDRNCDFDFLRREIPWVNYVRDRQDAQVHVLVTRQGTGGGRNMTLNFIGLEWFTGRDFTHEYTSSSTDTEDEERVGFARVFAQGLIGYAIGTPLAERLDIAYRGPRDGGSSAATPEDDPWNYWVFRTNGRFSFNGQERRDGFSFGGGASASRTTEDWKIQIGGEGNLSETNFEFEDGEVFKNKTHSYGFGAQVVRTVSEHWGVGAGLAMAASTFSNLDPSYRASGALQYNFYPFSQSSTHEATLTYFVGVTRFDYQEETIFEVTEETRADHGLLLSLDFNRPWGEAGFDIEASHFLDTIKRRRLEVRANLDYRIFRGLSVGFFGGASSVSDQIFLPRRDATDEEVLLERRALATDFNYRGFIRLSYTFGSIYNNVVNSRFTGSSGGFSRVPGSGGNNDR